MYEKVSFKEAIQKELRVMDMTAISLCKENSLPIKVFNINKSGELKKLIQGEPIGTLVWD
jgi:uridylate kinase